MWMKEKLERNMNNLRSWQNVLGTLYWPNLFEYKAQKQPHVMMKLKADNWGGTKDHTDENNM